MLCSLGMSYRQGGEFGVCGVSCTIYLHGYSYLGIESLGNDHEEKRGGNAFWGLWYAVILCGQCMLGRYEGKLLLFYSGWDIIICCWQMIQADTFSPLMQRAYWIVGHTFRLDRPVGLKRGPWMSRIVPILSPNVVILVIHQVLPTSNSSDDGDPICRSSGPKPGMVLHSHEIFHQVFCTYPIYIFV